MLREIHTYNKKLEKLLEKNDKVTRFKTASTVAVSPKAVKALLHYWQHADRLYALMHHSWGCQCKSKHCAFLWLQHRTSPTFEFKLLVLWSPMSLRNQTLPPWDRQGLHIKYSNSSNTSGPSAATDVDILPPAGSSSVPTAAASNSNGKKKRSVNFGDVRSVANFKSLSANADIYLAPILRSLNRN